MAELRVLELSALRCQDLVFIKDLALVTKGFLSWL